MRSLFSIVGVGETLWDVFPDGAKFGGAPANFACTAAQLFGPMGQVSLFSAVGDDALGHQAISELKSKKISTDHVRVSGKPTGRVDVTLDEAGHASYVFAADVAWDSLAWTDSLAELAAGADAVCFGTLGQRSELSKRTIQRFVRSTRADCLRVFDINLRPPFWESETIEASLEAANVLKLNEAELPILAEVLKLSGKDDQLLRTLLARYGLDYVSLTRGERGAILANAAGEWSDVPAKRVPIVDTVGAGDAYTATLVAGLLAEMPMKKINLWAVEVAAFVCSQPGGTPSIPANLSNVSATLEN